MGWEVGRRFRGRGKKEYSLTCLPPFHSLLSPPLCSPITQGYIYLKLTSLHRILHVIRRPCPSWRQRLCFTTLESTDSVSCPLQSFRECESLRRGYRMSTSRGCVFIDREDARHWCFGLDGSYSLNWLPNQQLEVIFWQLSSYQDENSQSRCPLRTLDANKCDMCDAPKLQIIPSAADFDFNSFVWFHIHSFSMNHKWAEKYQLLTC